MASRSTQALIDKLRDLPEDKLAEVEDFVDLLRTKQRASRPKEWLDRAVEAGHIKPPDPGHQRSSIAEAPPVSVPGRPLSEIVLEDRR